MGALCFLLIWAVTGFILQDKGLNVEKFMKPSAYADIGLPR